MPRTGRPAAAQAKWNKKAFEATLAIGATMEDCVIALGMSAASIKRAMKKEYGRHVTFDQLARENRTALKLSARRNLAIAAAKKDPKTGRLYNQACAIHLAKVVGEWTDRITVREDDEQFAVRQQRADLEAEELRAVRTAQQLSAERVAAVMALLSGVARSMKSGHAGTEVPASATITSGT
jgi:hypothetical protein